MSLTPERMGEIGLQLYKEQVRKEGIHVGKGAGHKIRDLARKIDIDANELHEFSLAIAQELLQEAYSTKGSQP